MSEWLVKKHSCKSTWIDTLLLEAYSSKTRGLFGTPYCSYFRPTLWVKFAKFALFHYSPSGLVSPPNFISFWGVTPPCIMKREGERWVTPRSEIIAWDWDYSPSDLVSPPIFILGCDTPPSLHLYYEEKGGRGGHTPFWNNFIFWVPHHTRSLILREIPL